MYIYIVIGACYFYMYVCIYIYTYIHKWVMLSEMTTSGAFVPGMWCSEPAPRNYPIVLMTLFAGVFPFVSRKNLLIDHCVFFGIKHGGVAFTFASWAGFWWFLGVSSILGSTSNHSRWHKKGSVAHPLPMTVWSSRIHLWPFLMKKSSCG